MHIVKIAAAVVAGSALCTASAQLSTSHQTAKPAAPAVAGYVGGTYALVGGSDSCATPDVVVGLGSFAFDLTLATTGVEGQNNGNCFFFGTTGIDTDVWFTWTATATGVANVTTCSQTGIDSKIAVYNGSGCPTGQAIACNDDACQSLQSNLNFDCIQGNTYTIQIGVYPGSPSGTGTFTLSVGPPPTNYVYDDGSTENTLGLSQGGAICWMHNYNALGGTDQITGISSAYGSLSFPSNVPNGNPSKLFIWEDPNDDGNPNDCVLLATIDTTVQQVNTDQLTTVNFPSPISVTGRFFVGAMTTHVAGDFVAPMDQSQTSGGRAWVAGDNSGVFNATTLTANNVPPAEMDTIGFPSVFLLRAETGAGSGPGTAYCFGDGTGTPCPCGNNGAIGEGCAHSMSTIGGKLAATGTDSFSADDLVLNATQLPSQQFGIIFVGDTQVAGGLGSPLFDGLVCVSGNTVRYPVQNSGGSGLADGAISQSNPVANSAGLISGAGQTWNFQCWYRNVPTSLSSCGTGANLSNALSVTYTP